MADRLSPDEFRALGEALFGPKWTGPMARALEIHLQTVYTWRKDGAPLDTLSASLSRYIIRQEAALDLARRIVLRTD